MTIFNQNLYFENLQTQKLGRPLFYKERVTSTMTIGKENFFQNGTVILAEEQTEGKGRRARSFHSPKGGNLFFTLVLHYEGRVTTEFYTRINLSVPLSTHESVHDQFIRNGFSRIQSKIKWPNDVYVNNLKLSGMLVDTVLQQKPKSSFEDCLLPFQRADKNNNPRTIANLTTFLVGVGINVNVDPSETNLELKSVATSMKSTCDGHSFVREKVLASFLNRYEYYLDPKNISLNQLLESYQAKEMNLNKHVMVIKDNEKFKAKSLYINTNGRLVVRKSNNEIVEIADSESSIRSI
ncbi:holocarboxylase synthetase (biotin-(proprionyl-coa-carboxylase (atp-hydrolyzing)) ligase) [Anaeramoeba flamelloides]|uniref:Holocarboxylase synthetase (Biotin-(Proprionyl-coa-carboxylase (Atp-hydrolyzing)) ligase) n=1 Tax=Anaeramoeba flamelloides TaxID=1746091 RepID=A0AAV8A8K7_9EUKA|nr:holocarboxylase synthetase (biotin-(proprionyl-coa-carboxylase (atp-hydrolyzing)) ligase) [Anaeramoeba flamelloides]KAJ6233245.1 holocarboxylase synthetase (biotin-(proprionyl-coa-carboxylase (atp-hydrolyzing)) ligase) [Anaeramoeba flamelloides]